MAAQQDVIVQQHLLCEAKLREVACTVVPVREGFLGNCVMAWAAS